MATLAEYWESVRTGAADRGTRVPPREQANNAAGGMGAKAGFQTPAKSRGPRVPPYTKAQVKKL
jgi:hypothetical protein